MWFLVGCALGVWIGRKTVGNEQAIRDAAADVADRIPWLQQFRKK